MPCRMKTAEHWDAHVPIVWYRHGTLNISNSIRFMLHKSCFIVNSYTAMPDSARSRRSLLTAHGTIERHHDGCCCRGNALFSNHPTLSQQRCFYDFHKCLF